MIEEKYPWYYLNTYVTNKIGGNRAVKVLLVGTAAAVEKQGVRNEIQIASDTAKVINDKEYIIPLRLEVLSLRDQKWLSVKTR